jgi:hypothetical protein
MAIEVGCFSVTKSTFSRNFPAGSRAAPVPLKGILIVEVYSSEPAGYFEAMIVCVFNWKSKWFSARFTLG